MTRFLALAASALASAALGAESPAAGTLSFVLENDSFYDSDRGYTSGLAIVWASRRHPPPGWAVRIARRLPWFPEDAEVHHGFVFGQNMYTPRDIKAEDPPRDDRPYAGWLYGTLVLGVEAGKQLDQVGLTLGVVGPSSLAEQSQKLAHELRDTNEPRGWDTQLGDEPGIVVSWQRSWRELATTTAVGLELDLTPHVGGALGNVYTYANAGVTLRYGSRLPRDYGPPRIPPSIPGSGLAEPTERLTWYFFAGVEGRAVGRNIFLDGNTFRDSRSVDRKPLVADLQFGFSVAWRGARVSYTHVERSREFTTQQGGNEFGAFTVSMPL